MTNDERRPEPTGATGSVTGVARGGHGTGTALDDTQVYDVVDLTAAPIDAGASQRAPEAPARTAPEAAAPTAAPVAERAAPPPSRRAAPAEVHPAQREQGALVSPVEPSPTRRRTGSSQRRGFGAPVAGLVGFAIAACLAIIVGASLGMTSDRDANADATFGAPATEAPAPTEANDGDEEGGGNGKGNKGCNGNGRGNCDDD